MIDGKYGRERRLYAMASRNSTTQLASKDPENRRSCDLVGFYGGYGECFPRRRFERKK